LDKGRSVGGRLATRRIGEGKADHGAQFFTVRSDTFKTVVERWLAEGLAFEWSRGWSDGSQAATSDGHARYAIRDGMNELAQHLARGLDVRSNICLVSVTPHEDGWQVTSDQGGTLRASALILTPPVPQSLMLVDAGRVPLQEGDRAILESINYDPCLAAMFSIEGTVNLPPPGAVQRLKAPISWIADNQRKGISPEALIVTAQAGPAYSRQLWDVSDERVLSAFRVDLLPFLGARARIVEAQLKRWRYSMPINHYAGKFLRVEGVPPLIFAGDAFGGPRVEGAFLSGLAAGAEFATL
jgi:predicted NAD/FAD-dependent oxidoreductase